MLSGIWTRCKKISVLPALALTLSGIPMAAQTAQPPAEQQGRPAKAPLHWESAARMHKTFSPVKVRGSLVVDAAGIEFRRSDGRSLKWNFVDIHTVSITPHRLVIETYLNRSFHRPGEREYRFDLTQTLPPAVAAGVADAVARPSQNADPDPTALAIATVPVRHRTLTGGTNGVLRFRKEGIDYVATSTGDSRSWRWADLQTLSDPDAYHLFVFGFRDTYTFDLKAPLPRTVFDWATDEIYQHTESADEPGASIANEPAHGGAKEHDE